MDVFPLLLFYQSFPLQNAVCWACSSGSTSIRSAEKAQYEDSPYSDLCYELMYVKVTVLSFNGQFLYECLNYMYWNLNGEWPY